jgi:hypothetical protein
MQPPNAYGINCARCGAALELPADLNAAYCNCPYCGLDNVLPEHVVQVRRQQLYEIQRQQAAAQAQAFQARAKAEVSRSERQALIAISALVIAFVVMCSGVYVLMGYRRENPKLNGDKAVRDELAKLQKQGCDRVVVPLRTYPGYEQAEVSLDDLGTERPCVHVLAATSSSETIKMRDRYSVIDSKSMPAPASTINFRACQSVLGDRDLLIETGGSAPFTVAAIECPRLPSEGGSRTNADDLVGTGKAAVRKRVAALVSKGCNDVVQDTTVARGEKVLKLTFAANASCYNFFVGSSFPDVKFALSLTDANDNPMPVPDPARELRLIHCPTKAGDYKLVIKPSTPDHYAFAGVECPRDGSEGLTRERELRTLRDTGAKN